MAQTASMRATSLAASAALLGAGAIVALTFSYELPRMDFPFPEAPTVRVETEPPPPQPERPVRPQVIRRPLAEPVETINTAAAEEFEEIVEAPTSSGFGEAMSPTVTSPHWLRRPTNLQVYYPRRALEAGTEGEVVLDCLVTITGHLRCSVVSETPAGSGFAQAAQRIAADHQMRPAMRNGGPVEGRYRMRVPFRVD